MTEEPDLSEVAKHTAEFANDRDMSFGAAAVKIADRLDNIEASEIIQKTEGELEE
jgi:hypothetical protein